MPGLSHDPVRLGGAICRGREYRPREVVSSYPDRRSASLGSGPSFTDAALMPVYSPLTDDTATRHDDKN